MTAGAAPNPRWLGLDALRGLSIAAMILVNNPGSWAAGWQFGPLRHADWHGCTFTDLVFPTFLFCAGVAIVPALTKKQAAGESLWRIAAALLRRVGLLILLGLLLSAFPLLTFAADRVHLIDPILDVRFPGVLQRIGVCYGIAALLLLCTSTAVQRVVLIGCLLLYWPLITLVPVPGLEAPDISHAAGTLQGWLDRAVFGAHIYKPDYDPEGLLSTIPALGTCLLGVEAGRVLARRADAAAQVRTLVGLGLAAMTVGYAWSFALPFNKPLWTSSYAVWTAGIACALLGVLHSIAGMARGPRLLRPLQVYGQNALLVFVGSGIVARIIDLLIRWPSEGRNVSLKSWFFDHALQSWLPPKLASLAFASLWVGAWYLVLRALFRRGIIWRV